MGGRLTITALLGMLVVQPLPASDFASPYVLDELRARAQADIMRRPAKVNRESDAVLARTLLKREAQPAGYLPPRTATFPKVGISSNTLLSLRTTSELIKRSTSYLIRFDDLTDAFLDTPMIALGPDTVDLRIIVAEIARQTKTHQEIYPDAKMIVFRNKKKTL